jgi:hypothetical protein
MTEIYFYLLLCLRLDFFSALNYLTVFVDRASKNENVTSKKSEPHTYTHKEEHKLVFKGALYFKPVHTIISKVA